MNFLLLQIVPPDLASEISNNFGITLPILGLYIFGVFATVYYARSEHQVGITDYTIASRSLGWIVVTLTIVATAISGSGVAGFPGFVWLFGISFVVAGTIGFATAALLTWYMGGRIWKLGKVHDFKTPGDLLGRYYRSDLVRVYTVIVSTLYNISYLVAQFIAGGILITILTGTTISFQVGVLILGLILLVHVGYTGLRGIAYLDTLNGTLFILLILTFTGFVVASAGGVGSVFTTLSSDLFAEYITIPGPIGVYTPDVAILWGSVYLMGIWLMSPAVWIRFYSFDKRVNIIRISTSILLIGTVIFVVGYSIIGVWGKVAFPGIENSDFVAPLLAFEVMPFSLAIAFIVTILAAIISTADSYLHALSTIFSHDFVNAIVNDNMSDSYEMRTNYGVMLAAVVISCGFALIQPGSIVTISVFAAGFTIMLFPPLFGAVAWPKASTEAAIVAPAVGSILIVVYQFTDLIPNPYPVPTISGLVVSFAVCSILFVGISYLTNPVPMEQIEEFHGNIRE